MCYLDTYNCTVSCLNSNLNTTSAMNGTIESMGLYGSGCHVASCELVSHYSEGAYMNTLDMNFMGFNLYVVGFVLVCIVLGLAVYYYTLPEKKED